MKNASQIWESAIPCIKDNVSSTAFTAVFTKVTPAFIQDNTLYLHTSSELYKDIFDTFQDRVNSAVNEVCGEIEYVKLIVDESIAENENKTEATVRPAGNDGTNLNGRFTLDNFIVGKNSDFAYSAAFAIAQGIVKDEYNPLLIYGGSGLGKTHLLHAVGNEILRKDKNKKVLCITSEKFFNQFIEAIKTKSNIEFHKKFRSIDVLLLDDIQFFAGRDAVQEEFFHTFNDLINHNKQIMLTSDRPPKDIYPLEERLRTRLSSGLMVDLKPPDFETRIAILHSKVEMNNFDGEIPDEILQLVAAQIKSNIRELEGAIRSIIAWSDLQKKEIDVDTANNILEQYFTFSQRRKIDASYIIQEVQKHFNLREDTITSAKRDKSYTYPRQIAMYICRELTALSLPEIGKEFRKDHSTVLHNINKIKDLMEKDLDTMNYINDLIENIKNFDD